MITFIGIVVVVVGLLVFIGQSLSFLAPDIATRRADSKRTENNAMHV